MFHNVSHFWKKGFPTSRHPLGILSAVNRTMKSSGIQHSQKSLMRRRCGFTVSTSALIVNEESRKISGNLKSKDPQKETGVWQWVLKVSKPLELKKKLFPKNPEFRDSRGFGSWFRNPPKVPLKLGSSTDCLQVVLQLQKELDNVLNLAPYWVDSFSLTSAWVVLSSAQEDFNRIFGAQAKFARFIGTIWSAVLLTSGWTDGCPIDRWNCRSGADQELCPIVMNILKPLALLWRSSLLQDRSYFPKSFQTLLSLTVD